MDRNTDFLRSLSNALSGFCHAVMAERNLRFHIYAFVLVSIFAHFFGLDKIEWIALILTASAVIICELVNTAVENAINTATHEYSETAKLAKDVAAGAVLFAAAAAVAVGILLFADVGKIMLAAERICSDAKNTILVIAAFIAGAVFVVMPGRNR